MSSRSNSQFTSSSSAFHFSANARRADDSDEHIISFRMSALPSRNSSTRPISSAELLEIMLDGLQLVAFVVFYLVGIMLGLIVQMYCPSTGDSDVNEVSFVSDSMSSSSSAEPSITFSTTPELSSASPEPSDPSPVPPFSFVRSGLVSSASMPDLLQCLDDSPDDPVAEPRMVWNLSCSDIDPAMLEADIGPHHHIHALLSDAWDENRDLRQKLQATRDSLEVAYAQMDDVIDERNDMAEMANAYISQIMAERDALIAQCALNDVLAAEGISSSASLCSESLAWTDDCDSEFFPASRTFSG